MSTRRKLDLPDDRPASFDEHGHHVDLTAEYAQGNFRKRRDWVYLALVIVFLDCERALCCRIPNLLDFLC